MIKGILRGLLIGVIVLVAVLLYVWLRYKPHSMVALFTQLSNDLFQIALLVLIAGVIIFTRLFSFRRRMGFVSYRALMTSRTRDDFEGYQDEQAKMNEEDQASLVERGRDVSLLVSAIFLIAVSVLLTINQAQ